MLAVVTLGVNTPASEDACPTTTPGAVTVPVVMAAPLFVSVPLAVVVRTSVVCVAEEHPVNENVALPPPAIDCAAGVAPVQAAMAVGVTASAWAPPPFVTFRLAVNT